MRSTVQNWRIMSLAAEEIGGSVGKWIGLPTILFGVRERGIVGGCDVGRFFAVGAMESAYCL